MGDLAFMVFCYAILFVDACFALIATVGFWPFVVTAIILALGIAGRAGWFLGKRLR